MEPKKKVPFKRNYVACLNCRTRKVKCDLGSVETPHDPPCARCKRERKECVFVESKRGTNRIKAHTSHIPSNLVNPDNNNNSNPIIKSETENISINPILPLPSPYFHSKPTISNSIRSTSTDNIASTKNNNCIVPSNEYNLNSIYNPSYPMLSRPLQHAPSQSQSRRQSSNELEDDDQQNEMTPTRSLDPSLDSRLPSVNSSIQSLTNNATMIYLAHVAGKVATIDNRNRINESERLSKLEKSVPIPRSLSNSNTTSNNNSNVNLNVVDDQSPSKSNQDTEPIQDSFGHGHDTANDSNSLHPIINQDRLTIPPLTTTKSMRQTPTSKLNDIEYIVSSTEPMKIKSKYILTDIEARKLIKIFFITMHPFYPYIPSNLRDPDVLVNYPILLCALLAISSRYNSLPDKIGEWDNLDISENTEIKMKTSTGDRHLAVHEQLWIYCQRLMSMTVWGESSSRSVGTLLTFLIFTEWNPRAIHFRWGDYANSSTDDSLANTKVVKNKNVGKSKNDNKRKKDIMSTPSDDDGDESEEEFVGLSAMKRSEIMSFMLIGTATRLSFLLKSDPLTFIATHISEIQIAVGLNKKSMLQQTLSEVDVNEPDFQFTSYQKANIELLQFFSLCYETLYGTRPKFISLDKYQTLAILDILSPILENWYRKYHKLLKPSNIHCAPLASCNDDGSPDWLYLVSINPKLERDLLVSIERESLIFDYYYTKLYLYSLALSGDTSVNTNLRNSKKGRNLRLDELARYSRYVELAYKAAKEVLAVIQRVRKLRLIKYMPVRWVTRIIKSVSFIVKCYLTLTTNIPTNIPNELNNDKGEMNNHVQQNTNGEILKLSVIPLEEIITLLQKTAICLRYAAPDELHLCTRYSTILMYLCSQFKTQIRERNDKLRKNIREYEKDAEFTNNNNDNDKDNDSDNDEQNDGNPVDVQYFEQPNIPNTQFQNFNNDNLINQVYENKIYESYQQPQQHGLFDNNARFSKPQDAMPTNNNNIEKIDFSNANQELFDDFFNKNPSETLFNFFSNENNNPGLDFVDQFTKEMEKDFLSKGGKH